MSQGYPSFPSWDEARPATYAPPPPIARPAPRPGVYGTPRPGARPAPAAPVSPPIVVPAPSPDPAPQPFTPPASPRRHPGMGAAVAVTVVAAAALAAAGLAGFTDLGARPGSALPASSVDPGPSAAFEAPAFPVAPTGPAVPTFPESSGGAGAGLRQDAPAREVAGATFGRDEKTGVASPTGWPFAFRIPGSWTCVPGKIDLPETRAVVCQDRRKTAERAGVILRACPSTCGAADRKALDRDWFVDTGGLRRADGDTRFRQTAKNAAGRYQLELGHYFTDPATGTRYQVGVDARTSPANRAAAQKVVNEVLSQTTF